MFVQGSYRFTTGTNFQLTLNTSQCLPGCKPLEGHGLHQSIDLKSGSVTGIPFQSFFLSFLILLLWTACSCKCFAVRCNAAEISSYWSILDDKSQLAI